MWKSHGFRNQTRHYPLRPMFGNLDNHGYLLAGMNANHVGAAYSVSDLIGFTPRELDKEPRRRSPRVTWPFDDGGDGKYARWCSSTTGNGSGDARRFDPRHDQ